MTPRIPVEYDSLWLFLSIRRNGPQALQRAKLKPNLKQHLRLHEPNLELRKPYFCTFQECDYRTSTERDVQKHVQGRHTANRTKDFPCALCLSKFYTQNELNKHIQSHVKEKRFACNFCNYKTHEGPSLRIHIRNVHQKLFTFKCSFHGCHYGCTRKNQFDRHLRKHNPDPLVRRPIPCTFPGCGYRAAWRWELKRHVDTHHNSNREKKFSCCLCSQTFYTQQSADSHLRGIHLKEMSYKCNKCSYSTTTLMQLKKHDQRMHDDSFAASELACQLWGYRAFSKQGLSKHSSSMHPKAWHLKGFHNYVSKPFEGNREHSSRKHSVSP